MLCMKNNFKQADKVKSHVCNINFHPNVSLTKNKLPKLYFTNYNYLANKHSTFPLYRNTILSELMLVEIHFNSSGKVRSLSDN